MTAHEKMEIIKVVCLFANLESIRATISITERMTDDYLVSEFTRIANTIPPHPAQEKRGLFSRLFGGRNRNTAPVLNILRDDMPYIRWQKKHGVYYEALEMEMNQRQLVGGLLRGRVVIEVVR